MNIPDGIRSNCIRFRSDHFAVATTSEEGGLVDTAGASLRVREDADVIGLDPNKRKRVQTKIGVSAKELESAMVEVHGKPEHDMCGRTTNTIKVVAKTTAKSPISSFAVIVASVEGRGALIELVRADTVGEVTVDEVELGADVGGGPK